MNVPDELMYTKEHEWISVAGDVATVGITDHAQDQLGDVVFVELPDVGAEVGAGQTFGSVESVKAVSDLFAPLSGEVVEINESLTDSPESINEDPYGGAWLIKVKLNNKAELESLMSPEDYKALTDT